MYWYARNYASRIDITDEFVVRSGWPDLFADDLIAAGLRVREVSAISLVLLI